MFSWEMGMSGSCCMRSCLLQFCLESPLLCKSSLGKAASVWFTCYWEDKRSPGSIFLFSPVRQDELFLSQKWEISAARDLWHIKPGQKFHEMTFQLCYWLCRKLTAERVRGMEWGCSAFSRHPAGHKLLCHTDGGRQTSPGDLDRWCGNCSLCTWLAKHLFSAAKERHSKTNESPLPASKMSWILI